jgi:hypothetical protein
MIEMRCRDERQLRHPAMDKWGFIFRQMVVAEKGKDRLTEGQRALLLLLQLQ